MTELNLFVEILILVAGVGGFILSLISNRRDRERWQLENRAERMEWQKTMRIEMDESYRNRAEQQSTMARLSERIVAIEATTKVVNDENAKNWTQVQKALNSLIEKFTDHLVYHQSTYRGPK